MEDDRAKADLGEAVDAELQAEGHTATKQPRRRFMGRKAAADRAVQNEGDITSIESSGAIQGTYTSVVIFLITDT